MSEQAKNQQKKRVVITGGSSGTGKAMVKLFARSGYDVLFTYCRGEERAQALCKELDSFSVKALLLDQGSSESIKTFLKSLPATIDCLIINAGLGSKTVEHFSDDSEEQDRVLMEVNALGPLWLCRNIIPAMEQRGSGKVILMSSVGGGITSFAGMRLGDQMSKAALSYLGKQYAAMLADTGVDIFTVCPGAIDTPMFQASSLNHLNEKEREEFITALPGSRLINAEDIAELCLFLCSETGKMLRGSVLDASMGLGSAPGLLQKKKTDL